MIAVIGAPHDRPPSGRAGGEQIWPAIDQQAGGAPTNFMQPTAMTSARVAVGRFISTGAAGSWIVNRDGKYGLGARLGAGAGTGADDLLAIGGGGVGGGLYYPLLTQPPLGGAAIPPMFRCIIFDAWIRFDTAVITASRNTGIGVQFDAENAYIAPGTGAGGSAGFALAGDGGGGMLFGVRARGGAGGPWTDLISPVPWPVAFNELVKVTFAVYSATVSSPWKYRFLLNDKLIVEQREGPGATMPLDGNLSLMTAPNLRVQSLGTTDGAGAHIWVHAMRVRSGEYDESDNYLPGV